MEDRLGNEVLKSLFQYSDDGFIVVDKDGIVLAINEQYASYFAKDREEIIGHPIEETISTTSMYDVMEKGLVDSRDDVYLQPYVGEDLRAENGLQMAAEIRIPALRFCVYDENQQLIGAAAQMKFPDRTEEITRAYREAELDYYRESYQDAVFSKSGFENMLGSDPKVVRVKNMGIKAARSDFPVLITGETGTGKEVMAKSIHLAGSRRDKPFVAINCGAIPENLLESELFGYEGGSFTGAKRGGKPGKFEQANGGTIFLDEIGDMPLHMQVKLLRVLQEGEIDRIGGTAPVPVDVRVLSATRRNLIQMMQEGTFREDLFYRLAVVNIRTVPLRECPRDILMHCFHHLGRLNRQYRTHVTLSESAKLCLLRHNWPGNIRELQNVISSAYAMCDDEIIEPENLPQRIARLHAGASTDNSGTMSADTAHRDKNIPEAVPEKPFLKKTATGTATGIEGSEKSDPGEEQPVKKALREEKPEITAPGKEKPEIAAPGEEKPEIDAPGKEEPKKAAPGKEGPEIAAPEQTAPESTDLQESEAVSPSGSPVVIPGNEQEGLSLREKLRNYERYLIREALENSAGSMADAARRLKVERSLLYKKMEKLGMK